MVAFYLNQAHQLRGYLKLTVDGWMNECMDERMDD